MSDARVSTLDTLRGFALLGVLMVNLPWFGEDPIAAQGAAAPPSASRWDAVAEWVVAFSGHAKFFVLFSFLFGYGLALQIARAHDRGERLGPRFARRLAGIFVFGLLHATLLFVGDVLTLYALLGVWLWLVRHRSVASLLRMSAWAAGAAVLGYAALGFLSSLPLSPDEAAGEAAAAIVAQQAYLGTFVDAAAHRVGELPFAYPFLLLYNGPLAFAMFALGLAAGKARFFENLERHWPRLKRWFPPVLGLGVALNAIYATVGPLGGGAPAWAGAVAMALLAIGGPALCLAFVTLVIAAEKKPWFHLPSRWLQGTGRMSLTNYMGESVLAGFVFLGWGLGGHGQYGPATSLLLTPLLFAVLVLFSSLWLRVFRNGPEEWLLRTWTYLRPQQLLMRKSEPERGADR